MSEKKEPNPEVGPDEFLRRLSEKLAAEQTDLPPDFEKLLRDHFWELLA